MKRAQSTKSEMNKTRTILLIVSSFLVGAVIGATGHYALIYNKKTKKRVTTDEVGVTSLRMRGYTLINPLLDFELKIVDMPEAQTAIEKEIQKYISENKISSASVYFKNLNTGHSFGVNLNEKFTPASLLKVPMLIACLKQAEIDPAFLSKKITFSSIKKEQMQQNIINGEVIELGKIYSVEQLINYMISASDNNATHLLYENIDGRILDRVYTDLNLEIPGASGEENYMSVKDYGSFFKILYNASYLNRDMSEKALKILSNAEFNKGIVAGLPQKYVVAHKFGERVIEGRKQLHDCGIVYFPDNPCLICIMTRGHDFHQLEDFIQHTTEVIVEKAVKGKK